MIAGEAAIEMRTAAIKLKRGSIRRGSSGARMPGMDFRRREHEGENRVYSRNIEKNGLRN